MTSQAIPSSTPGMLSTLEQYRTNLQPISSRLSEEEYRILAEQIRLARSGLLDPQQGQEAEQRLLHSCLYMVLCVALRWKRTAKASFDLLDMIQEGNIVVLDAIQKYPFSEDKEGTLAENLVKPVTWAIINGLYTQSNTIRISQWSYQEAKRTGKEASLTQQPYSLDRLCEESEADASCLDILEAPAFILRPPPECPPAKAHLLALLLAELPLRQREILQLRYGLGIEGVSYDAEEVAQRLGTTKDKVGNSIYRAMRSLRTLYTAYEDETGQTPAFLAPDEGFITYLEQKRMDRAKREEQKERQASRKEACAEPKKRGRKPGPQVQEKTRRVNALLFEAFTSLQQMQDKAITGERLAREAGVGRHTADRYLRQRNYSVLNILHQRLEDAYAFLLERSESITCDSLSAQSGVNRSSAARFLRSLKNQGEAERRDIYVE